MIRTPAEWEPQNSIWVSWPHNEESWGKNLSALQSFYSEWIQQCLHFQNVNVLAAADQVRLPAELLQYEGENSLTIHDIQTDDIWIRDYGPLYTIEESSAPGTMKFLQGVCFKFNSWGEKFPPWDNDAKAAQHMCGKWDHSMKCSTIILEGGAIETNGQGIIITTEPCLWGAQRNPLETKEKVLRELLALTGAQHWISLPQGLPGDHTDGHIDNLARFLSADTIAFSMPEDHNHEMYESCKHALESLEKQLDARGFADTKILFLPVPELKTHQGECLPRNYANFIFLNNSLVCPVFNEPEDQKAIEVLSEFFTDREIIPMNSELLILEGGSLHCASKHQPEVP